MVHISDFDMDIFPDLVKTVSVLQPAILHVKSPKYSEAVFSMLGTSPKNFVKFHSSIAEMLHHWLWEALTNDDQSADQEKDWATLIYRLAFTTRGLRHGQKS